MKVVVNIFDVKWPYEKILKVLILKKKQVIKIVFVDSGLSGCKEEVDYGQEYEMTARLWHEDIRHFFF